MKVTLLGCGSSAGVPFIGCDCPVCRSTNPKNKRLRVSALIEINGINLLIDSSPDLRQQALLNNIRRVDAVLYTHDHADHCHGLDDLRSFNYLANDVIPIYGNEATITLLQQRFAYAFLPKPEMHWYRASLTPHILPDKPFQDFSIAGVPIRAFEQRHGKSKTLGYRFGDFAYSVDTNELPESAFEALQGIDTWVIDCLRYKPAPSHAHLEMTLGWIDRIKPRQAILTHMSHEFDYDTLAKELPPGVVPGYNGMILDIK